MRSLKQLADQIAESIEVQHRGLLQKCWRYVGILSRSVSFIDNDDDDALRGVDGDKSKFIRAVSHWLSGISMAADKFHETSNMF